MTKVLVGYCFLEQREGDWLVVAYDKKGAELGIVSCWEEVDTNFSASEWDVEVSDSTLCGKRRIYLREK